MNLDKKERLSLVNQFLILEKLYPDEAHYYASRRKAVEEGYELHYDWIYENLSDGLNKSECERVVDILNMFRVLHFSSQKSQNEKFTKHYYLKFEGFDGNKEYTYMAYCRYFIVDLDRFEELKYNHEFPDFNSHSQRLPKYSAMLNIWDEMSRPYELTDEQAISILEARDHD